MSSTRKNIENLDRDKLKKFIEDNGYTYIEITKKMGVAKGFLSHVVLGNNISTPMYKLLCSVLKVDESYFLTEVETMDDKNKDLLVAIYKELKEINYNIAMLADSFK